MKMEARFFQSLWDCRVHEVLKFSTVKGEIMNDSESQIPDGLTCYMCGHTPNILHLPVKMGVAFCLDCLEKHGVAISSWSRIYGRLKPFHNPQLWKEHLAQAQEPND